MIKFENFEVVGIEHAIRGMKNSLNLRGDDDMTRPIDLEDLNVIKRFSQNPGKHRDPLSMIFLYVDITAPLYFWHELDTYRIRSIEKRPITDIYFRQNREYTLNDFCCEKLNDDGIQELSQIIEFLNKHREYWRDGHETKDGLGWYTTHKDWWTMISLMPSSYMQTRTAVFSYRELRDIYILSDNITWDDVGGWHEFRQFIDTLPNSELMSWDTKELHERLREENRRYMESKRKG
jgi:hypothetical protein